MALLTDTEYSSQELLQGQLQLWHQSLGFFKSLALAVAMDLRVADTIHRLGGAATLPQILAEAGININPCKLRDLRRVMRALTVSGIFTVVHRPADGGEGPVYKLTAASRLLVVGDKNSKSSTSTTTTSQLPPPSLSLSLQVQLFLETCRGSAYSRAMRSWFQNQPQDDDEQRQRPAAGLSPFAMACDGQTIWERAERDAAAFPFDDAMASDTAFLMPILLRECGEEVFGGLTSLVDVAGGLGGAASSVAAAFPDLKCTVLDLPQVVAKAQASAAAAGTGTENNNNGVQYVAGDMFQSIPPADAVFLKWILHDWSDDECVRILEKCRQAILPSRAAGGNSKVIIVDMVVGGSASAGDESSSGDDVRRRHVETETQVLFDLLIMCINGVERDEQEWKKIFFQAGFQDYRIIPVLGVRSIIELYP